jgi:energy-converting hydrogenase Eha subunit C
VEEAVEVKPTRVGFVLKTRDPVPVSSVTRAASFAEVSMEVLDTLLLKSDQLDAVKHPVVAAFATSQVIELTERVRPPEKVRAFSKSTPATAANTLPLELVLRRDEAMEEIARAEVVALTIDADPMVAFVANELVDDAVVAKKFVDVALIAVVFPAVSVPIVAVFALRLVDDALVAVRFVAERFVDVALVEVAFTVLRAVIVELAETMIPMVVVGARYPFTMFQSFPKSDEVAA